MTTRHVIPISGKDSLATAVIQRRIAPKLPYEYVFCDVRMELPETYAWLDKVEAWLGIKIKRVGVSLADLIEEKRMIPSHHKRFCTWLGKLLPIHELFGDDDVVQYLGIRADERVRLKGLVVPDNVENRFPLVEHGVNMSGVYDVVTSTGLAPPSFFWKRLYDEVMSLLTKPRAEAVERMHPWAKDRLFAWRSRSNCFMCFYQRLYEWVGLLEHHPDLYERAERIEASCNGNRRENPFWFRQDVSLPQLRTRAADVFRARMTHVYHQCCRTSLVVTDEELDLLSGTSCGVYCGK